jgi:hypothetical protein
MTENRADAPEYSSCTYELYILSTKGCAVQWKFSVPTLIFQWILPFYMHTYVGTHKFLIADQLEAHSHGKPHGL